MKRRAQKRKMPRSVSAARHWNEQRLRLLHAAQRAIHREGPQISMDEIAAEAGITKPIFYRHFGDRRGLACALRDASLGLVIGAPSDNPSDDRRVARERVASRYPVVSDPDDLRRVVVSWATSFQLFVEMNRNLYRFLRAEGAMDSLWEEPDSSLKDPVADSLAASLRAVFAGRGIVDAAAEIWANALRGMVREIVHWSTTAQGCDRFELERQFDLLTGVMIDGLGRTLAAKPATRRGAGRAPATTTRHKRTGARSAPPPKSRR